MPTIIQSLDWAVLDWIRAALSCELLDAIMPALTHLGDGGFIWILAALLLIATRKYRRQDIAMLCALGCGVLIGNLALKNLVARSRPCWLRPDVPLLIPLPTDYSFPSGHTLASVIGASCLARADRQFGFASIALAALIALSRLYLFVHFPSDVLASVVLGLAIAAGVNRAFHLRAAERSAG